MPRPTSTTDIDHAESDRSLILRLDRFAWDTIDREAAHQGLSVEELVTYSILYYLADADSGRVARKAPARFMRTPSS